MSLVLLFLSILFLAYAYHSSKNKHLLIADVEREAKELFPQPTALSYMLSSILSFISTALFVSSYLSYFSQVELLFAFASLMIFLVSTHSFLNNMKYVRCSKCSSLYTKTYKDTLLAIFSLQGEKKFAEFSDDVLRGYKNFYKYLGIDGQFFDFSVYGKYGEAVSNFIKVSALFKRELKCKSCGFVESFYVVLSPDLLNHTKKRKRGPAFSVNTGNFGFSTVDVKYSLLKNRAKEFFDNEMDKKFLEAKNLAEIKEIISKYPEIFKVAEKTEKEFEIYKNM